MKCHDAGVARSRAALCWIAIAGMALAAGCTRYERKPLLEPGEFRALLAERPRESEEARAAMPDGIDLAEAEVLCLHLNPRLRAARARAGVPAAAAAHAGLWDDPEFSADLLRILESPDHPWIAGASLAFTLPISGRLGAEKDHATAEARAAMVDAWAEEQAVLRDLREAWADWSASSASTRAAGNLLGRLDGVVAVVDRREELGETIAAEGVAFRLAQARERVERDSLAARECQDRLRVLELAGLLHDADVPLVASPGSGPVPADAGEDLVFERNPAVLAAAARHDASEDALRLEVRRQYPDLQLGPAYGREDGENRLGAGFSVPVPILNANRQGIAEADAARLAARAEWERAVQEALAARARAAAALEAAAARRDALAATVVPLAQRQIAEARRLADIGEIDALLLLEALRAEREAEFDMIEAEAEIARCRADLLAIVPPAAPQLPTPDDDGGNDR